MGKKEKKAGRHRKAGTVAAGIILAAAAVICAVSVWNITAIVSEDASSDEVTDVMRTYVRPVPAPAPPSHPGSPAGSDGQMQTAGPEAAGSADTPADTAAQLAVDFDGLRALNDDITAWIDIPGTEISYPVLQTDDDSYYLTHSADGTENRAGSIFLDSRSSSAFTDRNTILYGHRMNNGSMFGTLSRFSDASYLREHPYVFIYVPGAEAPLIYEIAAVRETDASLDSPVYQTEFADAEAYDAWVAGIDAGLDASDQILTLSTCVRGDGSRRFIVEAKRVQ